MNSSFLRFIGVVCFGLALQQMPALAADDTPATNNLKPALNATPSNADATTPIPALPVDRIVAIVNDDIITRLELDDATKTITAQLRQQNTPLPPADALEKQVLEHMIVNRVQLQYAKDDGITVDDATLEKTIERVAEGNKLSVPDLQKALQKDGIDFQKFREEIRDEVTIQRVRQREVDDRIIVSDSEVDSYLQAQKARGDKIEEFDLSHILIRVPEQVDGATLQKLRARADQALAKIKSGADFRQVAAEFSDAPDATQGGALGWREYGRLPSLFADAVSPLKPGEVTDVLRSPNGFHILRVNDKRGSDAPVIVKQTHVRHILIKTNEIVSEDEAHERAEQIKKRLDAGADFAEMARLQSEDMSASRGGDLGWLNPGDTVPDFEKAMNALKPNEISAPVRTQFGWHIIQVLERRDTDMSKEQQRLRAQLALRAQKSDDQYQEWVRQLRDRAFVEYRLDASSPLTTTPPAE